MSGTRILPCGNVVYREWLTVASRHSRMLNGVPNTVLSPQQLSLCSTFRVLLQCTSQLRMSQHVLGRPPSYESWRAFGQETMAAAAPAESE